MYIIRLHILFFLPEDFLQHIFLLSLNVEPSGDVQWASWSYMCDSGTHLTLNTVTVNVNMIRWEVVHHLVDRISNDVHLNVCAAAAASVHQGEMTCLLSVVILSRRRKQLAAVNKAARKSVVCDDWISASCGDNIWSDALLWSSKVSGNRVTYRADWQIISQTTPVALAA